MEDRTESAKRIAAPKGRGRSPSQSDGLLGRNFLKGMQGDAMTICAANRAASAQPMAGAKPRGPQARASALLCGAGHNLSKLLARMRAFLRLLSGAAKVARQGLIAQVEAFRFYRPALQAARIGL